MSIIQNLALPFKAWKYSGDGWGNGGTTSVWIYDDDATVSHSGTPSIKVYAHTSNDDNSMRELDQVKNNSMVSYPVKAGDHIQLEIWIKQNSGLQHPNGLLCDAGAYFGFDIWATRTSDRNEILLNSVFGQSDLELRGIGAKSTFASVKNAFAPIGCDWTRCFIDVVVPQIISSGLDGRLYSEPFFIIPQLHASDYSNHVTDEPGTYIQEQAITWFADPKLSVNNDLVIHTCPTGQHWDESLQLCVPDTVIPPCSTGQHWDPTLQQCIDDAISHVCPTGQHWDQTANACVNDATPPTCPFGQHWDPVKLQCVDNTILPPTSPPDLGQPYIALSGSISVGGFPFGGYALLLPPSVVRKLWRLRQKYIRPEVHKKLHPLV